MEFHPQKCTVIHVTNKRRPLRSKLHPSWTHTRRRLAAPNTWVWPYTTSWSGMSICQTSGLKPIRPLALSRGTYMDASLPSSLWPTRQWSALPWSTLAPCGTPTSRSTSEHLRVPSGELPGLWPGDTEIGTPGCMTAMVQQLQWDTLAQRRLTSRLVMLYKISHDLIDIHAPSYLTPGDSRTRGTLKYAQPTTGREVYNNSFFPRTIRDWNGLPSSVRGANNIEAFRMLLSNTQAACTSQRSY